MLLLLLLLLGSAIETIIKWAHTYRRKLDLVDGNFEICIRRTGVDALIAVCADRIEIIAGIVDVVGIIICAGGTMNIIGREYRFIFLHFVVVVIRCYSLEAANFGDIVELINNMISLLLFLLFFFCCLQPDNQKRRRRERNAGKRGKREKRGK